MYALKEMRFLRGPQTMAFRRFALEVETMQRLATTHAGIVPVVDVRLGPDFEGDARAYYVMPWIETTLASSQVLASASSLERVLEIGVSLADALVACHEATPAVIHRDVKPANVLLAGEGLLPQLADFGICFLVEDERARVTSTAAHTLGSDGFTAPELLGGGRIDSVGPAADIDSLGKTLYAVLAGGDPFPREFHREPRYNLAERFGDPRLEHLHGLLDRMVHENPDRRYSTMRECRDRLQQAVDNLRRGVPYAPGLYGGGESPRQRYAGLKASLALPLGIQRTDSLHESTQRALRAAEACAEQFLAAGHRLTNSDMPSAQPIATCTEIAEHLLAVGLPVVRAGDLEELEYWIDHTVGATDNSRGRSTDVQALIGAGSVIAIYGAAASTWILPGREKLLGVLVARFRSATTRWIHLAALGNHSGRILSVIQDAIAVSPLVALELGAKPAVVRDALTMFPALAALTSLASFDDDTLQHFVTNPRDYVFPQYPCFYVHGAGWVQALATGCMLSPARERALATEVFGTGPEQLRQFCSRVRKGIARLMAQQNPDNSVHWNFDVDRQGSWKQWLESVA